MRQRFARRVIHRAALNVLRAIAVCSVFSTLWLYAADPPHNRDYVINVWRTDEGLPDSAVSSIAQTRDGYLWIGTANGLARFDGVRFALFRSVNTPELHSNRILNLSRTQTGVYGLARTAALPVMPMNGLSCTRPKKVYRPIKCSAQVKMPTVSCGWERPLD